MFLAGAVIALNFSGPPTFAWWSFGLKIPRLGGRLGDLRGGGFSSESDESGRAAPRALERLPSAGSAGSGLRDLDRPFRSGLVE